MENVVVSNPVELEKTKKAILEQGKDKIHVLADFDRTLTKVFVNDKKIPSIISVLRDEDYLSPEYSEKAKALANKYYPIEIDLSISIKEKKKAMHDWWTQHFDLLIKSGLNKKHLKKVIEDGNIQFRKGASEFIDFLYEKKIPLIIMSSAGLGGDSISMYLKKQGKLYDNVHIVSNSYEWNSKGDAIGYKEPIIHVMNKDETAIQNYKVFDLIKNRKNVLLLGDSLGDVGMITGFDYDNLIKIGFLNEKIEENLEQYKENFDIILLNDTDFNYVNELVKEI
jgi:5'-nucleotidase